MPLVRNPIVSQTDVDDETFLVEPESDEIFHLDPIAGGLWRLLAEPRAADEIKAVFGDAFPDADPQSISHDVDAVLKDMLARGLVLEIDE